MRLFDYAAQYRDALAQLESLDLNDPAQAAVFHDTLEGLQGELDQRLLNLGYAVKNLQAECDAVHAHEKEIIARRRALENRIRGLKDFMVQTMLVCRTERVKHPTLYVRMQASTAAALVDDPALVPDEFCTVETVRTVNREAVKEALKQGQAIPGAHLEQGHHVVIR